MTEQAKFRYSAHDGIIELEGSEEFVTKHLESLTDIIHRMVMSQNIIEKKEFMLTPSRNDQIKEIETIVESEESNVNSLKKYPNVFSEINGKLKIVTEIPGHSTRHKILNIALLYCFGAALKGEELVSSKMIREVCEEHGCLDGANFSKIFDDKTLFLSDGVKGGAKIIKLTFQGSKKAQGLLVNV